MIVNGLKVRVENGRLVGPAPPGLVEGTELELCLADSQDDLTETQLAELNRSLEAAWSSIQAGRGFAAEDVIAELRPGR